MLEHKKTLPMNIYTRLEFSQMTGCHSRLFSATLKHSRQFDSITQKASNFDILANENLYISTAHHIH